MGNLLGQLPDRRLPVIGGGLADEAHGGVPGGIGAVEEPAPIGGVGQEGAGALAECAGQVGHGRIDGNDQIEIGHQGRGMGQCR